MMRILLACLTLSLMSACVAPKTDVCSSLRRVIGSPGWEERWTRGEKLQIAGHNEWIIEFCR